MCESSTLIDLGLVALPMSMLEIVFVCGLVCIISNYWARSVWLIPNTEIVPALLQHLNIQHVSLVCHSGGTVYGLNTLLYLRHILHPTRPYVALCAPWIHASHSGALLMKALDVLPTSTLSHFPRLAKFIVDNVAPSVNFSGGILGSILPGSKPVPAPGADLQAVDFEEKLHPLLIQRVRTESIQGLHQEALLFLKRSGGAEDWGAWVDYDKYVPLLRASEEERASTVEGGRSDALRVDVFFGQSDNMIGVSGGPKWF